MAQPQHIQSASPDLHDSGEVRPPSKLKHISRAIMNANHLRLLQPATREDVLDSFQKLGIKKLSKRACEKIFREVFVGWAEADVQVLVEAVPLGEDGFIDHRRLVDFIYLPSRKEFQGLLIGKDEAVERERIILISDMGQDNDDEMALLLLSELERRREVKLEAVIANLTPANRRAALSRGTLDIIDMHDVPVGIGTDGGSDMHTDTFSQFISTGMTGIDYFSEAWENVQQLEKVMGTEEEAAVSEELNIYDGQKLLFNTLSNAEDGSLNLVIISSLKDAGMLLKNHEQLFIAKIKNVTIMGGMQSPDARMETPDIEPEELMGRRKTEPVSNVHKSSKCRHAGSAPLDHLAQKVAGIELHEAREVHTRALRYLSGSKGSQPLMVPSDAHNNVFDAEAAEFFYRRCQELGVPLVVLSRFTAYGCRVQKFVYDLMVRCPVPHPTVCRLQRSQRSSIEQLWQNVCAGDKLPPRCDKEWFCNTFCNGRGEMRGAKDTMWDLVKTFNMYDPLAILACLPSKRRLFFSPKEYIGPGGVVHMNIGESKENCGIISSKVDDLHDFMLSNWLRAAGRLRPGRYIGGQSLRPKQLDQEQMTAALTPMMTHGPEELERLNQNVLALLDDEWPKLKNSSLLTTWRDRDDLMRRIGPEMCLVDPETIASLGRIPHSAEGKTITMEEAANRATACNMRFFIEMFSHRWHSPFAPDDRYCNKARVLCEWANYRKSMSFRTFYWIDHACINQSDIAPGVAMLPLYVSCCNNILCYDSPEYENRAWCRVERLMFSAFVAPNNEYIAPDFEHRTTSEKLPSGELRPTHELKIHVPDPSAEDANLSFKSDSRLIERLKELCTMHWAQCWKDGLMDIVEQKVGLSEVRNLRYGGTEVRMRRFM